MTTMPKFDCYTEHKSKNYGLNSLCFDVDGREFYFSYKTLIAFRGRSGRLVISRNYWGVTTGRHLNAINRDHSIRLSSEQFEDAYTTEMQSAEVR
jgi:hypothetical protein